MSFKKQNSASLISHILILLAVIAVMAFLRPESFWTVNNLSTVILQQAPYTILMAFGMSLAILAKGIDISMASVMVLSCYLSAPFFKEGNWLLGVLIAFGVGIGFGICNGLLISKIRIEPFIATFSVDFVALGIAYVVCNGKYIYGFSNSFRWITNGELIPGIPNVALITIVVFLLLLFLTRYTIYGRELYSVGYNAVAAQHSGIRVDRMIISVYAINGSLAALTGILFLGRLNAADPSIRGTLTMDSIASALVGGIAFGGGKGSVVNTVIGALIIMFIRNGMNILGISTNWQQSVVGLIILLSTFYNLGIENVIKKITALRSMDQKQPVQ